MKRIIFLLLLIFVGCSISKKNKSTECKIIKQPLEYQVFSKSKDYIKLVRFGSSRKKEFFLNYSNSVISYKYFVNEKLISSEYLGEDSEKMKQIFSNNFHFNDSKYIQSCPNITNHIQLDSVYVLRDQKVRFLYINYSRIPTDFGPQDKMTIGESNVEMITWVYKIYNEIR